MPGLLLRPAQTSAMCRLIARKSARAGLPSSSRHVSSMLRPYKFHIGASWAGKPPDRDRKTLKTEPFAADSVIGAWRDKTLSRPKAASSKDAGEDFFYVQEVRSFVQALAIVLIYILVRCAMDRYALFTRYLLIVCVHKASGCVPRCGRRCGWMGRQWC